jgi:hypothetical protein
MYFRAAVPDARLAPDTPYYLCRWKKALAAVSGTARSLSSSIWFGELHDGGGAVAVQQGLQDVLELLVA